jgi:hypothetical protein
MSVRDSESSNNGANGFATFSGGAVDELRIDTSTATNNTTGIAANGRNAVVYLTRSTVFANGTGADGTAGGLVQSYMNNSVDGNSSPGSFTTISQE